MRRAALAALLPVALRLLWPIGALPLPATESATLVLLGTGFVALARTFTRSTATNDRAHGQVVDRT